MFWLKRSVNLQTIVQQMEIKSKGMFPFPFPSMSLPCLSRRTEGSVSLHISCVVSPPSNINLLLPLWNMALQAWRSSCHIEVSVALITEMWPTYRRQAPSLFLHGLEVSKTTAVPAQLQVFKRCRTKMLYSDVTIEKLPILVYIIEHVVISILGSQWLVGEFL